MNTNQEKVKAILGEDLYQKLIENGYFPIEQDILQTYLQHDKEIRTLQNKLTLLEASMVSKEPHSIH